MPSADPTLLPTVAPSAAPDAVPFILGLFAPSDFAIIALTLVLVLVNIWYALQVRQTVAEMRRARGAAVLPELVIGIHAPGAGAGWPEITNVGPGAAINVDARISYLPDGPTTEWHEHVVAPNQSIELFPPKPDAPNESLYYLDEMTALFTHIRLRAVFRDALGDPHEADHTIEVREWWRVLQKARVKLPDHLQADAVKHLKEIGSNLKTLADESKKARLSEMSKGWRWERRVRKLPKRWQDPARRALRLLRQM